MRRGVGYGASGRGTRTLEHFYEASPVGWLCWVVGLVVLPALTVFAAAGLSLVLPALAALFTAARLNVCLVVLPTVGVLLLHPVDGFIDLLVQVVYFLLLLALRRALMLW